MKKITMGLIGLLMLVSWCVAQAPGEMEDVPRAYDDARVVRVKYAEGETYVKRDYEEGFEEAVGNLPVFDRDTVGTTDGRLELYLGRLNYLRLDYDSEINFTQAPQLRGTHAAIQILRGGAYLFVNHMDRERDMEIQTPDSGIFILRPGKYRINVNLQSGTEIVAFEGFADVSGEQDGVDLSGGQRVVMFEGRIIEPPASIYGMAKDDFSLWNRERNRLVDQYRGYRSRYLDPAYASYEYELSRNGRWMYDATYGTHLWIPQRAGASWRPYYNGRWVYNPRYGYVWNSYDPWGYYTHHYGRWHWSPSYGWAWVPGKRWAPAWVSWYRTDNYYGWAPLSHWNRPIVIVNNRWDRNYRYRMGMPIHATSVIIVGRNNLWAPRINTIALGRKGRAGIRVNQFSYMGRHPNYRPRYGHVSVVNAKGRTVRYKSAGFLSSKRYQAVGPRGTTVKSYRYSGGKSGVVVSKRVNRYSTSTVKRTRRTVHTGKQRTIYRSQPRKTGPPTGIKTGTTKRQTTVKRQVTRSTPTGKTTVKRQVTRSTPTGKTTVKRQVTRSTPTGKTTVKRQVSKSTKKTTAKGKKTAAKKTKKKKKDKK